jgi:hypothetical protein
VLENGHHTGSAGKFDYNKVEATIRKAIKGMKA